MMMSSTQIQQELSNLGYQDIKQEGARFPVMYDIEVRMELSPKPTAVISGKNGCSMKYRIEDEQSVDRTIKALKALNDGKAFYQIWPLLSH
jgi:hypothetical protein